MLKLGDELDARERRQPPGLVGFQRRDDRGGRLHGLCDPLAF